MFKRIPSDERERDRKRAVNADSPEHKAVVRILKCLDYARNKSMLIHGTRRTTRTDMHLAQSLALHLMLKLREDDTKEWDMARDAQKPIQIQRAADRARVRVARD